MNYLHVILLIAVVALCFNHYQLSRNALNRQHTLQTIIRQAADSSIKASTTINPILALIDITQAARTMDVIHLIYSPEQLYGTCNMDTEHMAEIIHNQRVRITNDVMKAFPNFVPEHPLINESALTPTQLPENLLYIGGENASL